MEEPDPNRTTMTVPPPPGRLGTNGPMRVNGPPGRTNGPMPVIVQRGPSEGEISGRLWFDPEVGLPREIMIDVSSKKQNVSRPKGNTTNAPPAVYTSNTRNHLELRLADISLRSE